MKKIGMGLAIFMLICLCSCGSNAKREVIRDNPADSLKTSLNLDSVQNGKSLNKDLDRSKEYYDVLVAEDTASSLFYQTIQLDEYVQSERLKQIDLKILYFNEKTPSNDVVGFLKEMNQEEYGINATTLGVQFKETKDVSSTLYKKLAMKNTISLPKDFTLKESDPIELVVAYVPVYCIYNDGKQDYTRVFLMIPVYYAFTYHSTLGDYTAGLKNVTLELVKLEGKDTYVLPSNEA